MKFAIFIVAAAAAGVWGLIPGEPAAQRKPVPTTTAPKPRPVQAPVQVVQTPAPAPRVVAVQSVEQRLYGVWEAKAVVNSMNYMEGLALSPGGKYKQLVAMVDPAEKPKFILTMEYAGHWRTRNSGKGVQLTATSAKINDVVGVPRNEAEALLNQGKNRGMKIHRLEPRHLHLVVGDGRIIPYKKSSQ